ncbi:hypothetical protein ACVWYI_006142 [Bradyrhizobium sp. LB13.1]
MGAVGQIVDRENAQTWTPQGALPPCVETVVIDDQPVSFANTVDRFPRLFRILLPAHRQPVRVGTVCRITPTVPGFRVCQQDQLVSSRLNQARESSRLRAHDEDRPGSIGGEVVCKGYASGQMPDAHLDRSVDTNDNPPFHGACSEVP